MIEMLSQNANLRRRPLASDIKDLYQVESVMLRHSEAGYHVTLVGVDSLPTAVLEDIQERLDTLPALPVEPEATMLTATQVRNIVTLAFSGDVIAQGRLSRIIARLAARSAITDVIAG